MARLVLACLLAACASAGPLDGSRWTMRFWSDRSWLRISKADKLVFDEDRFTSVGALSYGFAPSSYTVVAEGGGSLRWRSAAFNADGEAVAWEGRQEKGRPDRMEGVFLWRQVDGRIRRYRWKARRR